jgi:hypothetical protein
MTKINRNYEDETQIISTGAQLRVLFEPFWEKYTKEQLVGSFWSYVENELNLKLYAECPQIVTIQFKSKEEALKFKLKYL